MSHINISDTIHLMDRMLLNESHVKVKASHASSRDFVLQSAILFIGEPPLIKVRLMFMLFTFVHSSTHYLLVVINEYLKCTATVCYGLASLTFPWLMLGFHKGAC